MKNIFYLSLTVLLLLFCLASCKSDTEVVEGADISETEAPSGSEARETKAVSRAAESAKLKTTTQAETTVQAEEPAVIFSTPGIQYSDLEGEEFWFGSGAGAWGTDLNIFADGTFIGYFHDSNMGESGPGYPDGTLYECRFSGKFSPLERVGEYEYTMRCETLKTEGTQGEEIIEDDLKIITYEPYGFLNADVFYIYAPGKEKSELPEEFVDWMMFRWLFEEEISGTLDFYGLYNVGGESGFSSWNTELII